MSADEAFSAAMGVEAGQEFSVRLKPVAHPELGPIVIEDSLFAIGRNEPPFDGYDRELVAELSRRHARIFWEGGALYVADLGSKNGTSVNGAPVKDQPVRLFDRDELGLGGVLKYRVQIVPRPARPHRAGALASLTLTPVRDDLGLLPIVVERFPFLISKADEHFARYKDTAPHQVKYLSRRHAHLFLKGDMPYVEDLGSTNGTFVGGKRLDERAVELHDGDVIGFGGTYFVYKIGLDLAPGADPTLTKFVAPPQPDTSEGDAARDKTTFVAAAGSFLDIFCADPKAAPDEINEEAAERSAEAPPSVVEREGSRRALFLRELSKAFSGGDSSAGRRAARWALPAFGLLVVVAIATYFVDSKEHELKELLAAGNYPQALSEADDYLVRHPDDAAVKPLGAEALLRAKLPGWIQSVKAGDFERAGAALDDMKAYGAHNAEAQEVLGELDWIAGLEQFVLGRGGVDAPIRLYEDEDRIKALLQRWNDDPKRHRRALALIAAQVPVFEEVYAEALSHLRKLESDESVYLAAIERLNATIATELGQDNPEELEAVFNDYAEKYPRLAGMERLREDLRRYLALDGALQARKLGPLVALLDEVKFATPPFREQLAKLGATRLPSADVIRHYREASAAWREGRGEDAQAALQRIPAGPWADVAASQLEHRKLVQQQFKELQPARGSKGYEEQLLAFYGALDPDEDSWFVHATEADVRAYRDKALARANEQMNRAQALWRQYREAGGIAGEQRLASGISPAFRSQAALLSNAKASVQQGMRIYKLLDAEVAAQWTKVQDEIDAETKMQRRSLQELHMVLEPGLLKAKLALIGERSDEERKSP